ncbi:DUF2339 domain-containing protein [Sulfitobacter sp. SK012]|nr:DUF2339 domain-containing protein [Sulfitobacter sp. SK012]
MEPLFVLLGLLVLAIPVCVIGLMIGQSALKSRLAQAERDLVKLKNALDNVKPGSGPGASKTPTGALANTAPQPAAISAPVSRAPKPPKLPPRPAAPAQPPKPAAPERPSPVGDALAKFGPWLQENWFYAVSALSLALAGVFLVQYGMENGLLPPRARVAAALAFGAALIGVGEYIRRRFGDAEENTTAYLPSVFSGAGIVTLFGVILSARMLYGLIDGNAAMAGMVIVAVIALVLGWLYGPLLAAVGVIGAFGAPVVLSSSNSDATGLFAYFVIVAALGLGVDTIRRWGWVSALTMVLAYLSGWGLAATSGNYQVWAAQVYLMVLALLAIVVPARSVWPDHSGPTVSLGLLAKLRTEHEAAVWPQFPTLLAFGSVAASSISLLGFFGEGTGEAWLSIAGLAGLTVLLIVWSHKARALQDVAAFPALAFLAAVWMQPELRLGLHHNFAQAYTENPEAAFPKTVTILVVLATIISATAAWRSLRDGKLRTLWAAAAAIYAPGIAMLVEISWAPAEVIGAYPWALHAAGLAAFMAVLAERFARRDGVDRLRTSFVLMSVLSCMAFAFVIVLSAAALTVALAVTVVAAAAMDRRWTLPPMALFIAAGVVTLGYRLTVDPGIDAGRFGPLSEMLLAYGGTLVAFIAALWLLGARERPLAQVILDSAAWSTGGMFATLLIFRGIDAKVGATTTDSHWALGLYATIWLGVALAQVQRLPLGGRLRQLRWALTGLFGLIGVGSLWMGATVANPLIANGATNNVIGLPVFNTLAAAYLLPALLLGVGVLRLRGLERRMRLGMIAVAAALVALWVLLVVRHLWQGGEAMNLSHGVGEPELYSYTIGLLLIGAGLFYQSLARRSAKMRKAGLIVIGLAVAKVFLVDISGLEGLTRVFSLLVLGLSLAVLAWLNRWAQDRYGVPNAGRDERGGQPPELPDAAPEN